MTYLEYEEKPTIDGIKAIAFRIQQLASQLDESKKSPFSNRQAEEIETFAKALVSLAGQAKFHYKQ